MTDIQTWIKQCEGLKLTPYSDTTGHLTIGWGRNLTVGIRLDEAEFLFQNDFNQTLSELQICDWFDNLPPNVKNALINMNFNIGISKLLEFTNMITALKEKDFTKAAQEVLNSEWAKEVGDRAKDVALMIRQA
jgi:lysozyme